MSATKQHDPSETAFYALVVAAIEALCVNYADEIDDKISVNIGDNGEITNPFIEAEISRMHAAAAEAEEAISLLNGLADRACVREAGLLCFPDDPGPGAAA